MRVIKEAQERRNEILDAAEQLFAAKGFDGTSTADILNTVGIARGTLYYHFRSKEDILDAVIRRTVEGMLRKARTAARRETPLLERFTQTMLCFRAAGGLEDALLEQVHRPRNALLHQKMQEELLAGICPLVTGLIEEGIAEGCFRTDYPAETAQMGLTYAMAAFDDLSGLSGAARERKAAAFIYNLERLLGAEQGSLRGALIPLFGQQA